MNTFIIAENLNTDSAKKGGTMRVLKETQVGNITEIQITPVIETELP